MPLHHIIYLSTPTAPLLPDQLTALLAECRTGNQQRDITGLLFYGPRHFLQLIEGEASQVHELYQLLQKDTRHHNLIKVADKAILSRAFTDWSMAFRWLQAAAPGAGYQALESAVAPGPALNGTDALLLETVRQRLLAD